MTAHAAAVLYSVIPASQEGRPAFRYMVLAFLRRPDNRGNLRTFRFLTEHKSLKEARAAYAKRERTGKYLYGTIVEVATMDQAAAFGDESVESVWLDENQG